jgi:hypothetical protein
MWVKQGVLQKGHLWERPAVSAQRIDIEEKLIDIVRYLFELNEFDLLSASCSLTGAGSAHERTIRF